MPELSSILTAIYILLVVFTIVVLVLENRNPVKTQAWIVVLIFFPIGGLILYLFFGENIKRQFAYRKKRKLDERRLGGLTQGQKDEVERLREHFPEKVKQKFNIVKMLMNDSKALLTSKNSIKVFNNGKDKLDALLSDIRSAKNFIHLEYYIIADDEVGNAVKNALMQKAEEGVEVRVLFDDVGSLWIGKKYVKELRESGVKVFPFMPVWFGRFTWKVNYRNHRKIVVIDGTVGYVGGMNLANRYVNGDSELGPWRDTHLRIEGEAVQSLQSLFLIDWYYASDEEIDDAVLSKYLPESKANEDKLVQIISNGPDTPESSVLEAFFMAITTARESICISTPYLLPTQTILTALRTSALSGVDVKVIIPTRSDAKVAHHASLSYIDKLLKAGVKVYRYKEGFTHAKVMLVDDIFSSVGSANVDYRSFEHNFEVNALIYDEKINAELRRDFETDLKNSEEIIREDWKNRPLKDKVRQSLARVLAPLF